MFIDILRGLFGGLLFGFLGYATFAASLCCFDRAFVDLKSDRYSIWSRLFRAIAGLLFAIIWFAASIFLWGIPIFNEKASLASIIGFYIAAIIPFGLAFAQLIAFIKDREHFRKFNLL